MIWDYTQPVKIYFGKGRYHEISKIASEYGLKNGILVAGRHCFENELAEDIIAESDGNIVASYSNISSDPDVTEVDACADVMRDHNVGFVIAVGGGSVIDLAKAAAGIVFSNDSITRYHGTGVPLPKKHLPIIALPTTSGTGSEVTCVSVLTNREQGIKAPVNSETFYPVAAIVDPELTYSMPEHVTASCGIDVLAHAIEGFWSKGHQPICDSLALHAAGLVFRYLRTACENPNDQNAREKMSEASLIAGLAFTIPKTTSSHACSFPLTNLWHIPHGEACGLTLDHFARINAAGEGKERLERFAKDLGFEDAFSLADEIQKLKEDIHLRTDLKDLHLDNKDVEELVRRSHHPNMDNNPVEITDDMLRKMYLQLAGL